MVTVEVGAGHALEKRTSTEVSMWAWTKIGTKSTAQTWTPTLARERTRAVMRTVIWRRRHRKHVWPAKGAEANGYASR